MPQVQVRFRPVIRHKYLPMLIGVHRTRIHIDIRIKFLNGNPESPFLQKPSERSRRDSLSEGRDHPSGNKYEFRTHPVLLRITIALILARIVSESNPKMQFILKYYSFILIFKSFQLYL